MTGSVVVELVLCSSVVRCRAIVLCRDDGRLHHVRTHVASPHCFNLMALRVVVLLLLLLLVIEVRLVLLFRVVSMLGQRLVGVPVHRGIVSGVNNGMQGRCTPQLVAKWFSRTIFALYLTGNSSRSILLYFWIYVHLRLIHCCC